MNQSVCEVCGLEQSESMARLESKLQPNWKCSSCTLENTADKQKCVMCKTERSIAQPEVEKLDATAMRQMTSDEQLKLAMERSTVTNATQMGPSAPELRRS